MSVFWLRMAALLYSAGLIDSFVSLLRRRPAFPQFALGAFCVAAVLHLVAIVEQSVSIGHLAANNFFETASLLAFLIAGVYLVIRWRYQFTGLSLMVYPLVSLLVWIAALGTPTSGWSDPRVRGAWLVTHILLVLAGYVALLLSATASVVYLIQERGLKRKTVGGSAWSRLAGERMPALDTLDKMITRSMSFGFVAITLAVLVGSTWAYIETGTRWISSAKIIVSLVTWGFYLLMIFLRVSAGWRGRRAAVLALTVLGFAALTWAAHIGLRPLLEK